MNLKLSIRLFIITTLVTAGLMAVADSVLAQRQRVMTGVRFDGDSMYSPTIVSKIIQGGPADKAGILIGDEILSVDGDFVIQAFDIINLLKGKSPGDSVRIEVKRGDQFLFFDLKLIDHVKGDKIIREDGTAVAAPVKPAILDQLGPELKATQWHNWTDEKPPRLREMKDQVVCLLLFQTSCEYSKRYGIPQVKKIHEKYKEDPNVTVLAVQTPFHEFEKNTFEKAVEYMTEEDVTFPFCQDGSETRRSNAFDVYQAPGTPWIIIMDKQGVVRFNDSDLPIEKASELIDRLKSQSRESTAEMDQKENGAESEKSDSK